MDRFIKLHTINHREIVFNTRHIVRIEEGQGLGKNQRIVYCYDDGAVQVKETLEEIEKKFKEE